MQIGHSQKSLRRPIERTARIGEKRNSRQDDEIALALRQIWRRFAQLIASLTNSSAASASSVSPPRHTRFPVQSRAAREPTAARRGRELYERFGPGSARAFHQGA